MRSLVSFGSNGRPLSTSMIIFSRSEWFSFPMQPIYIYIWPIQAGDPNRLRVVAVGKRSFGLEL